MAADRALGHDLGYVEERLAANGLCWEQLGEIVAYNSMPASERVGRFVEQWYASAGHRAIMLGGAYTHAGGSWTTASNGYSYAAMIFVKLCNAPPEQPATPFTDIAGSPSEASITWVYAHDIMGGCTSTRFCPDGSLTRGQLAKSLAEALDLPPTGTDFYSDDESSRFEGAINRLTAAGLTGGCGGGKYCPGQMVRRGGLATALARALHLPATGTDFFNDDESSPHESNINRIAAAGITSGCGGGRLLPNGRRPPRARDRLPAADLRLREER